MIVNTSSQKKSLSQLVSSTETTMHRCTWVENPGEGVPKSLGGSRLSGKFAWGGPPISGFIAFLLTSVLKFA
jgi:hypothetical protein